VITNKDKQQMIDEAIKQTLEYVRTLVALARSHSSDGDVFASRLIEEIDELLEAL
jgi:hypothetical protein